MGGKQSARWVIRTEGESILHYHRIRELISMCVCCDVPSLRDGGGGGLYSEMDKQPQTSQTSRPTAANRRAAACGGGSSVVEGG